MCQFSKNCPVRIHKKGSIEYLKCSSKKNKNFITKEKNNITDQPKIKQKSDTLEGYSFNESKAVDEKGELIKLYHGSKTDFDFFDNSFTGKGNDAYGSGFYFNTDKETSQGYGEHLKEVVLNIKNPIIIENGHKTASIQDYSFNKEDVKEIIKQHPSIYCQPDDEELINPLSDFSEEFWNKESHSEEEIDSLIDKTVDDFFSDGNFCDLETLYGEENATEFRKAIYKTTGKDGVRVDFPNENCSHWIAWFPEQIDIL